MAEPAPRGGVTGLVFRGVRWKLVSQVVVQLTRVVAGLLIARSLLPEEYGTAAMVLAFSGFVLAFSDLALGAALVQRRVIDDLDASTAFWATVTVGTVLSAAGVALAGPIAQFYGEPRVEELFVAFSPIFLLASLGATQQALLTREMQFRVLELRQMFSSLAGAVVGIAAALSGAGPWAIILQQLATVSVSTLVLWLATSWRPGLACSLGSLRGMAAFSGNVFGTRFLYYTSESAASIVVGRALGSAALGTYTVAYHVILVPLLRIAVPIGEVLFPAFSRMQDDRERLARAWLRALRLLAAVCMPALAGLTVVAPDLVPVMLGESWREAVPIVQILAWVGLVQALDAWNGPILMALGRARAQFRASLLFYSVFIASYVVGVQWGVVGVAASYAIAITGMQIVYQWLTASAVGISPFAPLRAVSGVAQATLGMVACLVAARALLVQEEVPAVVRAALLVPLGIASFAGLCLWRDPLVVRELRALRGSRNAAAAETTPAAA